MSEQGYKQEVEKIEGLLNEYGVEEDFNIRKALAREIALIHILDKKHTFDFSNTIADDEERQTLKDKIHQQLLDLPLLRDDEAIQFGYGGCKPRYHLKSERKAMILLGLPASGKSTVAQVMSDIRGAYLIDSDIAKRKFPEFSFPNGANWVHEESDEIALCDENGVLADCLLHGFNVVIPKIGSDVESIQDLYTEISKGGYEVSLGFVELPKEEAFKRAVFRYKMSKRYVPLEKILKSKPEQTFRELKSIFNSTIHLSSHVQRNEPYQIIDMSDDCIWW